MNKKKVCLFLLIGALIICAFVSAMLYFIYRYIDDRVDDGDITLPKLSDTMDTFTSEQEFDDYIADIVNKYKLDTGGISTPTLESEMAEAPTLSSPSETEGMGDSGESITNVQEIGVDEGDIVKAYKDYLVILRRGRIFTVSFSEGGRDVVKPVDMVDAYPAGYTQGTWYDEMLIYKNTIIVIGYSYTLSATEIHLFNIDDEGKLTHSKTYTLDSNDYYSSRNYASRLVDDNLIFYMPYYLFTYDYSGPIAKRKLSIPQVKEWLHDNELSNGVDILDKTDIYKPVQDSNIPTLHVVAKCSLEGKFTCSAKAVLGPYSRTFYVSPEHIYVWVSDPYSSYYEEDDSEQNSYVYMISIEELTAGVVKAQGGPLDQFSFKEDSSGYLNVLLRDNTAGDAMWNSEETSGQLALMRVPLSEFTREASEIQRINYTLLTTPEGYSLQNRFAGEYLLYGAGSSWVSDENKTERFVYVKKYDSKTDAQKVALSHDVDRIEVMGNGAIVVGSRGDDLRFSSIELSNSVERKDTYILKDAVQGETRSHGYFYKQWDDATGIIGLPVRDYGSAYYSLFEGSSYIQFLKVDAEKSLSNLGSLVSGEEVVIEDQCEFSCTDWYGNARPIFYSGRIFALLGYELIEGTYQGNEILEVGREEYFIADRF